jgi:ubiquinone/menaquinone biosynthesis C-methylase UbiE
VDFARLGLQPGVRVLDLGCGAGRHAFEALRRGASVLALDADEGELNSVAAMFAAMREAGEVPPGGQARALAGDATAMPLPDASVDVVIAAEVLEHIPADQAAIAEIARVLRPGGLAAVTVPAWLPERVCWARPVATTTRTRCTPRTGGSSARSASATTITRWPVPTTGCWSGT